MNPRRPRHFRAAFGTGPRVASPSKLTDPAEAIRSRAALEEDKSVTWKPWSETTELR